MLFDVPDQNRPISLHAKSPDFNTGNGYPSDAHLQIFQVMVWPVWTNLADTVGVAGQHFGPHYYGPNKNNRVVQKQLLVG